MYNVKYMFVHVNVYRILNENSCFTNLTAAKCSIHVHVHTEGCEGDVSCPVGQVCPTANTTANTLEGERFFDSQNTPPISF